MPEFLKRFIESLSPTEAQELWDWLDENPDADDEMIEAAAENARS